MEQEYKKVSIPVNGRVAKEIVEATAAVVDGHPVPTLLMSLAIGYGIDAYGREFYNWPAEKLGLWIKFVVETGSNAFAEAVLSAERENLNHTARTFQTEPGEIVGKGAEGV